MPHSGQCTDKLQAILIPRCMGRGRGNPQVKTAGNLAAIRTGHLRDYEIYLQARCIVLMKQHIRLV